MKVALHSGTSCNVDIALNADGKPKQPAIAEMTNNPMTTDTQQPKAEFAQALSAWRASLPGNTTQEQAANLLGVPLFTYRGWERGRHMPSGYVLGLVRKHISKP